MQGPSIQFDNVSLTLGDVNILEGISFSVSSGEVHCIVGTNGGGKTSLVRSMLGQMPHAGSIVIEWGDASRVTGYVPQALNFDETLPVTVADFMAMACQRRPAFLGAARHSRAQIEVALERVGLGEKHTRKLGSLSGGERQRVLLAQALVPEPGLLVLDEPAAGLDASGSRVLEHIIEECREQGVTVVWINHDIAQVRRLADSVTGINRTLVLDGDPESALTKDAAAAIMADHGFAVAATASVP